MIVVMAYMISWLIMAGEPLTIGADALLMTSETEERRCSACGVQWIWWTSLVQVRGNLQGRVSVAPIRGYNACGREAPLTMGAHTRAVGAEERRDNAVGRQ